MKLASFDIFDTTLIRRCGRPENIFYILAQRLFPNDEDLREDFLKWRLKAEALACKRLAPKEPTLYDIYNCDEISSFAPYSIEQLADADRQTECDNLTANPYVRNLIAQKRSEGYTVCFISDMYLDSTTLKKILVREECALPDEKVYVSCECGDRKDSGVLFDIIKKKLNPNDWLHYGDNKHSDVAMPRKHGIRSTWVNSAFTPTEQRLVDMSKSYHDRYLWSILIGYQRAVRIAAGNSDFDIIAADFVAAAYAPYTKYLLDNAERKGITDLYFLSRDGYILYKTAQAINHLYPGIKLHYLFVSRKALTLPYIYGGDEQRLLQVTERNTLRGNAVDKMLALLGTSKQEMAETFNIGFDYKRIVTPTQENDFITKIFHSSYSATLTSRAQEKYDLLVNYFRQEGLGCCNRCALVDVGWLGTSRIMINCILHSIGVQPVHFYYLGVRYDAYGTRYGKYTSYFRSGELSTLATAIIENYFSASVHPTTIGYCSRNGIIEPQFPADTTPQTSSIIKANICATTELTRLITASEISFDRIFREWSLRNINAVVSLSDRIPLHPFTVNTEFDGKTFVRKLTAIELLQYAFTGKNITAFDKASLALTIGQNNIYRLALHCADISGRIRHKLYMKTRHHIEF